MKKVLITGSNSYVGTAFEKWMAQWPDRYPVDTIDVKDNSWRNKSFEGYDIVFHVAGIAHIKETKENRDLYYNVNRDLAFEVAKKSKLDRVKQFIFLSSMSVYGVNSGKIDINTKTEPKTNYGRSKLQAEKLITTLNDDDFKIAVLRPPIVYGKGCKGNYPRLAKFVLGLPFFPEIKNKRSMLYIDNLCEFVKLLIDDCSSGLFLPQNQEYMNISEMVRLIGEAHGKKIKLTKVFNPMLKVLCTTNSTVNKVFGDLFYEQSTSKHCVVGVKESIILTEGDGNVE